MSKNGNRNRNGNGNGNGNQVLNYILLISLVFLISLYIKQRTQSFKGNNIQNSESVSVPISSSASKNNKNNKKQLCSTKRCSDLVEFTNGKVCLGPSRDFHQQFNNNNDGKYLGWRNWWNKNVRKEEIVTTHNQHPLMASFFKNQENTKNIYL
jgi:hypothetical protein